MAVGDFEGPLGENAHLGWASPWLRQHPPFTGSLSAPGGSPLPPMPPPRPPHGGLALPPGNMPPPQPGGFQRGFPAPPGMAPVSPAMFLAMMGQNGATGFNPQQGWMPQQQQPTWMAKVPILLALMARRRQIQTPSF